LGLSPGELDSSAGCCRSDRVPARAGVGMKPKNSLSSLSWARLDAVYKRSVAHEGPGVNRKRSSRARARFLRGHGNKTRSNRYRGSRSPSTAQPAAGRGAPTLSDQGGDQSDVLCDAQAGTPARLEQSDGKSELSMYLELKTLAMSQLLMPNDGPTARPQAPGQNTDWPTDALASGTDSSYWKQQSEVPTRFRKSWPG
jgi:hypothetical protein